MLLLCECGCGEATPKYDRSNGNYRKGEHTRFVWGHHMRRGHRHAAKLTEKEVRGIRKRAATTRMTRRQIGGFYGVSERCVEDILRGKTWQDVV
jgi:hypothetical protein